MGKIFKDGQAPLYGRNTAEFRIEPFGVSILREILLAHKPDCSQEDLLALWTFTGGAARRAARNGDWLELEGRAGENAWLLRFDLSPRLVDWSASALENLPPSPQEDHDEISDYTVHFMEWYTPDMAGLARREPAARVLRGPPVL